MTTAFAPRLHWGAADKTREIGNPGQWLTSEMARHSE
jgi:hypothetical protein